MSIFDISTGAELDVGDLDPDDRLATPYNAPRTITASGQRIDLKSKSARRVIVDRTKSREWQKAAWDYYDEIGEVRFAFNLLGNIMSRIRLFPAIVPHRSDVPTEISKWEGDIDEHSESIANLKEVSLEALDRLDEGFLTGGLGELQRMGTLNLDVAGEFYLASPKPGQYVVASVDELQPADKGFKLVYTRVEGGGSAGSRASGVKLEKNAYLARIWRAHPRYRMEPDSSMLGVLDQAEKAVLLDRALRATARSRMHAGAMFIPDGITVSPTNDEETEEDTLEGMIAEGLIAPVIDESAATSIVPLILRGPSELGQLIKWIEIGRTYDPQLMGAADQALGRVLAGLDIPKDVVTGLASVKYSNAIVLSDDLYRAHVEPRCMALCDALTNVYYRPFLRKQGVSEALVQKAALWYDPSAVVTRPDRSTAANEGYDRMVISGTAWRTARGFTEKDKPTDDELLRRVAFEKATGLPPDTTVSLMEHFAPSVFASMRSVGQQKSGMSSEISDLLAPGAPGEAPPAPQAPTAAENTAPKTPPGGPEGNGGQGGEIAPGGTRPPQAQRTPALPGG